MPVTVIQVKVKPSARRNELVETEDGTWQASLKAPPIEGRANEALVALVAKHFGCRKSAVAIKSGATARVKLLAIDRT